MTSNILLAILVTSIATYSSRFLGVLTSERINENSKIYRWFNCLAYSTLAALISRMIIFPAGILAESDYFIRLIVIVLSILIFYVTKKNLVYPTVASAIILFFLNSQFAWKNYNKMYKKCGVGGTTGWGDHGQETLDIAVPFFVKNL